MATLIDGSAVAARIRQNLRARVDALAAQNRPVRLDAILVSSADETAAHVYAQNQARTCKSLGIDYALHELPAVASQREIVQLIRRLNTDPNVHALMVHMPLPPGVDIYTVRAAIDPAKDVEGVSPANIGAIVYEHTSLAPCTALAVMRLIDETPLAGDAIKGKRVVIVGASDIVGKPIAAMLMGREATVMSCNKFTDDLPALAREAEIVVAAAGVAHLVTADWVKPGAVVVDVGIHRVPVTGDPTGVKLRTVGDVDADSVSTVAGWLSPVPGGVGPVTVAMLLANVVAAAATAAAAPDE
ncbi:MAG: bifunctional 5,10-methylenetetrahydrofolate dehydrogenase/5,10-methenyltetrahydrofolate cyclohydrolase [Phycisphaerales bacterium]|nr:bifunctional 5,10-methylenetetrahydrofolate dehydrogenase/5,10-methenyltetrahydrofolate cyclohydrolase [Phycisphaerales bacterium]